MGHNAVTDRVEGTPRTGTKPSHMSGVLASPYFNYALLLLVLIFFAAIRYRLRGMPLERDEGEYAYGGQLLLQHIPLYRLEYTVKLPGTHAAYALMLAIIGESGSRLHIGLIFVNAATTLLVFLLFSRLFGRLTAIVAAASYAALSTSSSVTGFAGHATHFVILFALAGTFLLLKALDSNKHWLLFCAGLLFGTAFLMKQPGLFFFLWAIVYVIGRNLRSGSRRSKLTAPLAILVCGGLLPFIVTCLAFWRAGSFQQFWFWTFSYAREYGTSTNLADGLSYLQRNGAHVTGPAKWIWILAAIGLSALFWSDRARRSRFFICSFAVFSVFALASGFYFRPHYFILILPAVSLLVGLAISCATELLQPRQLVVQAIPIFLFLVGFVSTLYGQRNILFVLDPVQACRETYTGNPFPEALAISDYISSNTPANATVAVLGSEPEIYFYTHRRSATGYIYTYPLLEQQKYARTMQNDMEAEVEKSRPDELVLVNVPKSWIAFSQVASPDEILRWAHSYIHDRYDVAGLAELGDVTKYYWGVEARDHIPSSPMNIYVLTRKTQ